MDVVNLAGKELIVFWGDEEHRERVIAAGIGWVLLASATSGLSGYLSLPTAPLLRSSSSYMYTCSSYHQPKLHSNHAGSKVQRLISNAREVTKSQPQTAGYLLMLATSLAPRPHPPPPPPCGLETRLACYIASTGTSGLHSVNSSPFWFLPH